MEKKYINPKAPKIHIDKHIAYTMLFATKKPIDRDIKTILLTMIIPDIKK